jgi:hypothetical protein
MPVVQPASATLALSASVKLNKQLEAGRRDLALSVYRLWLIGARAVLGC